MLKIAVWNLKGGTAKSTTALNLGAVLAARKRKVLLIDLDGQRTLSFGLGIDKADRTTILDSLTKGGAFPYPTSINHLSVIPGDIGMFRLSTDKDLIGEFLNRLRPLGFDVVLMDCPPSLGFASVQAVLNSDRVLLPTLCEPAALKGVSEAVNLIRGENESIPIDVLRTRHRKSLILTREADDLLVEGATDLGYRLLYASIPENISVAESIAQQQPVIEYAPSSSGAIAYKSLGKEVVKLWGLS